MAKLVRPSQGRMLLGVCAGLADWWNMDRTLLRVLYVLVSVCSGRLSRHPVLHRARDPDAARGVREGPDLPRRRGTP